MSGILEALGAWQVAAAAVLAAGLRAQRSGRRRRALNESLHELRRPLQAIALSGGADRHGSVHLAAAALERLDRQINGGAPRDRMGAVDVRPLIVAAVDRWRARARVAQASLTLRWRASDAVVRGDSTALAQAIDNLIVNAIQHGGPDIRVEGVSIDETLRVAVLDSGRESGLRGRAGRAGAPVAGRRTGRRRGHGLNVVRRVAAEHGGRFEMRAGSGGVEAAIELPLAVRADQRAA
jgi:signal transduction histidine kinase